MVNSELMAAQMINTIEKKRISNVHSIGPRVISWLEQAGYEKLDDFADETPENISFRIEVATGNRRNQNALSAYANLIAFAKERSLNIKLN